MSKSNGSTPTLPVETLDALHSKPGIEVPTPKEKITIKTTEVDNSRLKKRKAELEREFEAGQKMLADLGNKTSDLQATLLRISGAIQVLEELIAMYPKEENNADLHRKE